MYICVCVSILTSWERLSLSHISRDRLQLGCNRTCTILGSSNEWINEWPPSSPDGTIQLDFFLHVGGMLVEERRLMLLNHHIQVWHSLKKKGKLKLWNGGSITTEQRKVPAAIDCCYRRTRRRSLSMIVWNEKEEVDLNSFCWIYVCCVYHCGKKSGQISSLNVEQQQQQQQYNLYCQSCSKLSPTHPRYMKND